MMYIKYKYMQYVHFGHLITFRVIQVVFALKGCFCSCQIKVLTDIFHLGDGLNPREDNNKTAHVINSGN